MKEDPRPASIVFAAGKGSRVKGFEGNKTLLPLIAGPSPLEGTHPILLHVLNNLPPGPKALVVNYRKEEVIEAMHSLDLTYCEQPLLNGTGGALIAAREFLAGLKSDLLLIAMGDVPFVRPETFKGLLKNLGQNHMTLLGFKPKDKREYGLLDISEGRVRRIVEWKYWSKYPRDRQDLLELCNSGIYAARKEELVGYLDILERHPHNVLKERDGKMVELKEFFITDLVELMHKDGLKVGYVVADNEDEVMGVDDLASLKRAQEIFKRGL